MEAVKGFYRSARKAVLDVSEAYLKTEEATNDDAWGKASAVLGFLSTYVKPNNASNLFCFTQVHMGR